MSTATDLIAAERQRQIDVESPEEEVGAEIVPEEGNTSGDREALRQFALYCDPSLRPSDDFLDEWVGLLRAALSQPVTGDSLRVLSAPGDLNERRAWFIYEGARYAAAAAQAPIIPEPWEQREESFRAQFLDVIARETGPDRKADPRVLHEDWVRAYEAMGWVYGQQRDPVAKTHPDMVPYDELGQLERDKDAVFVALCDIARQWVYVRSLIPATRDET